jgi:hypothetical protein
LTKVRRSSEAIAGLGFLDDLVTGFCAVNFGEVQSVRVFLFCVFYKLASIASIVEDIVHCLFSFWPQTTGFLIRFVYFAIGPQFVETKSDFFEAVFVAFEEGSRWISTGAVAWQKPFRTTFAVCDIVPDIGYIDTVRGVSPS